MPVQPTANPEASMPRTPTAPPEDPHPAVVALLAAYARGAARGGSTDWDDLDRAYELAAAAYPDTLATLQTQYPPTEEGEDE